MLEPVRPKGPPLNALRAFESAARLGGFAAAASELCVTPGAITQHIKTLEAWVGAPLFKRHSKGVVLTVLSESTFNEFVHAFDQLGSAVQNLRSRAAPDTIRIAALPSIAQLWLAPRLEMIHKQLPDLKLSITAIEMAPNLLREAFDISLFFTEPPIPDFTHHISSVELFPVRSPQLGEYLNAPQDLAQFPLLQDATLSGDWSLWMSQIAPDIRLPLNGPSFCLYSLALEEAKNGAGVLIGHTPLVEHELERGTLIIPFAEKIEISRVLSLSSASSVKEPTALQTLVDMLLNV